MATPWQPPERGWGGRPLNRRNTRHGGVLAAVLPAANPTAVRRLADRWLNNLATGWIAVNNLWIGLVNRVRWEVDPLPLIVSAAEWARIEAGIAQHGVDQRLRVVERDGRRFPAIAAAATKGCGR